MEEGLVGGGQEEGALLYPAEALQEHLRREADRASVVAALR